MRNIHVVSHTHWDREWYRPFQDFRLRLVHLIDGLLDLLEHDPHFKFFMLDGQTIILEDYLALRPEKEASLRRYILKGRILIGPWHILPDMFLVGPEAHIRNLLQGDQTARKFGPKMMVGYIPDPFGHPGQVPQILRGFGIQTACLWRGLDDQPAELWWDSPDGSRVLMAYLRDSYSNGAALPGENPAVFTDALGTAADSLSAHSNVQDVLVMYGTDHMEPPPGTSKAIAYANKHLPGSKVMHSTLPEYIAAVQADIKKMDLTLPTVTGELRSCKRSHLLPGVLSTRMWIKQRNHASENLLTRWVEPFSTFQEVCRAENGPANLLKKSEIVNQAWRLLMQNHPHDSICGCSIDQVHDEMKIRFDQVDQIGQELTRQSLEALANQIDTNPSTTDAAGTPGQETAVVVFNPSSNARTDVVNSALELPPGVEAFDLVDEHGSLVPHQSESLADREIVNMVLDLKGLQSALALSERGAPPGFAIQDVKIRREGAQVFINATLAEEGEPNLAAWTAGLKQLEAIFPDRTVKEYHVRARSMPSARILFTARQVPGLGYRTFWMRPRAIEEPAPQRVGGFLVKALLPLARLPWLQKLADRPRKPRPPYRIENEFFVVEADRNGTLNILEKTSGLNYTGLNHFVDGGDRGDEYNYSPPENDRLVSPRLKGVKVETGPVQQCLELKLEMFLPAGLASDRRSRAEKLLVMPITSRILLSSGVPRVDIRTRLNNQARDHRLRVHFPVPFAAAEGSQDGHFEVVTRPIGLPNSDDTWIEQPRPEVPQRAFTDVSDGTSGLMLANRGLPEVEVLKNEDGKAGIALTLLRCVGWLSRDDFSARKGHAGPFLATPGAQMPGEWSFDYSIIPHRAGWQNAFQQAYAFETPLQAVSSGLHAGNLAYCSSFVETSPETFVVSAVKRSMDGRGWLVRGYNITGEPITVTLKPWRQFKQVELVHLAEEKISALKADRSGCVTLPVGSHALASVLFRD